MKPHRFVKLIAPIAIAVILGPLVAGLVVWLFAIGLGLFDSAGLLPFADWLGLLFLYVILAYFIGWPIALLAGLLVSLWMARRPPNVLVISAAALIATAIFMGVAALGVLGPVQEANGRSNFWFTLVAAFVAANVCWLLMRRFALKSAGSVQ